jgi:hypothetical protein
VTNANSPQLFVVVDTEAEFDWSAPFSRESTATASIPAQERAQEIFDSFGIAPTYVLDYPVASDARAVAYLRKLEADGRGLIGAHLHPWVTPPHEEPVNAFNSYHCNLPEQLERAKIEAITARIAENFGKRPTIFKSGRYGLGKNTVRALIALGYRIDCSVVPNRDFSGDGGPDFTGFPTEPYWLDEKAQLLEAPLTTGYMGWGRGFSAALQPLFDRKLAHSLRLTALMARSRFLERASLTPEGVTAAEQKRLIRELCDQGRRTFSLAYHSPSLLPGHTPYVRTDEDLKAFLAALRSVFSYFRDELGGRFVTLQSIYDERRALLKTPVEVDA